MKALILYFSGTGNTKFIAKQIAADLEELQCETMLYSIEDAPKIEPDSYDLLVLGSPKYFEYPVFFFLDYLKKNLPCSSKPVPTMMYCTQASPLMTDFTKVKKMLAAKNHNLIIGKSLPVANNFLIFKSFEKTTPEKRKANLEAALAECRQLSEKLVKGTPSEENIGKALAVADRAVAVLCNKLFPVFAMKYGAGESCIGCGLCAKKCPKNNIKMANGRPEFGKSCIFCTRCVNNCPVHAITYHNQTCEQYHMIEKI